MIYKFVPTESVEPTEEAFSEKNAMKIRVEKLEDVIFIKVPHDISSDALQSLDSECSTKFGDKKYIILSDTVNFVKLEEVK